MSRFTQYIGLSYKAKKFVDNLIEIESKTNTTGLFGEKINFSAWRNEKKEEFVEVLQREIWSSGPVIYTALQRWNPFTKKVFGPVFLKWKKLKQ